MTPPDLMRALRLPVIAAPMFLVSNPEMVIAACRAGIVGSFPALNARSPEIFRQWLDEIDAALEADRAAGGTPAPYAVNIILAEKYGVGATDYVEAARAHEVPLVITSVGNPAEVAARVKDWGGLVFHDVISIRHAEKAAAADVDGLILVTAGAGGHSGTLSPFALLPQVRRFYDGVVILAGGITDGHGVAAARALGADLAYMGTRFIATHEAGAPHDYKRMIVEAGSHDIVYTDAISGIPANFIRQSIESVGLDPKDLPAPLRVGVPNLPPGIKPWKSTYSAGHGVGLIDDTPTIAELVDRLEREYREARARLLA